EDQGRGRKGRAGDWQRCGRGTGRDVHRHFAGLRGTSAPLPGVRDGGALRSRLHGLYQDGDPLLRARRRADHRGGVRAPERRAGTEAVLFRDGRADQEREGCLTMSDSPVIRIVKKKSVHGGHHGGAWKVAYADFVTAMMAFFLVMWIIAMDQPTRLKIQSYFNDPASSTHAPAGISQLSTGGHSPMNDGFTGIMTGKNTQEAQKQRFLQVEKSLKR